MNEITNAIVNAVVPLIPGLIGAMGAAAFAWLMRLRLLAHVQDEVAMSAVRQAMELHGDNIAAEQAAADELDRMAPKLRPKEIGRAVREARVKVAASSQPPPPGTVRPLEGMDDE